MQTKSCCAWQEEGSPALLADMLMSPDPPSAENDSKPLAKLNFRSASQPIASPEDGSELLVGKLKATSISPESRAKALAHGGQGQTLQLPVRVPVHVPTTAAASTPGPGPLASPGAVSRQGRRQRASARVLDDDFANAISESED
ncbi:hypothetical protein WJX74_008700 [Apatococcus lobatus]|uniref:Uncharacterized protein n=1 Tax=Apatococcus lobatus TaxID=904363 RepID=A0AAW1RPY9_9CHLO